MAGCRNQPRDPNPYHLHASLSSVKSQLFFDSTHLARVPLLPALHLSPRIQVSRIMAKRKRNAVALEAESAKPVASTNKKTKTTTGKPAKQTSAVKTAKHNSVTKRPSVSSSETIQVIAGSYDRILHGFTATITSDGQAEFADSFLFNAHTSAIRCLAISPPSAPVPGQGQKVFLASGSTDERINVYNLSAHPPSRKNQQMLTKVAPRPILENRKNRELGTLLHHASTVTALAFPTRSKLLSSSEDSTIGITRTRDWSLLSSVKAPIPVPQGRPSGDTAPFGGTPAGVNDFAVHPSMKVMISVSKSERCMRLWNLVTGKKAGVLNFDKTMLQEAGESKYSTGEGRRVIWGSVDGSDEFAVGFERDVIVFGMDSTPKCRLMPTLRTKVHHFEYIELEGIEGGSLLAVSTDDGRIMLFSTAESKIQAPEEDKDGHKPKLGLAKFVGFVGDKTNGASGRIKAFVALHSQAQPGTLYLVGGCSDGKSKIWTLTTGEIVKGLSSEKAPEKPLGKLVGSYETQSRITCMAAFAMIPRPDDMEDSEDEVEETIAAEDGAEADDSD